MTEYESIMSRLEEMRSRYDDGFSSSDRIFLEGINYRLFHKVISLTGCSNCYRDAYLIIRSKLKKDKAMPAIANYILKNGILLHEFGTPDYYSHDVTDEVAEYFLKKNPADIKLFQKYPDDWKERIAKSAETTTATETTEASEATEEATTTTKTRKSRKSK